MTEFVANGLPSDICLNPIATQGRIKESNQMETSQNVQIDLNGLHCRNDDQQCHDYEVRFCCSGNINNFG